MVVDSENGALFQCRVFYIGSAVPLEQPKGLEAIQQPLRERFCMNEDKTINGMDVVISVLPTEIKMTNPEGTKTFASFPISTLTFCAAVRGIHVMNRKGAKVLHFVSLNSPAAGGMNADKPPIFAAITRRMKGRKVLECHAFLCHGDSHAKNLVQASKMADRAYRGGLGITGVNSFYANSRNDTINSRPVTASDIHLIPADQRSIKTEVPQEFFDVPPSHGYFYSENADQIKSYIVEKDANVSKTLDRPSFKAAAPAPPNIAVPYQMVPAHPQYVRHVAPVSMKKGGPILVNTLPPPKRFLSPSSQPIIVRNGMPRDPYMYVQPRIPSYPPFAYRVVQSSKDRSPSSCQSSESGDTIKAKQPSSNSVEVNGEKEAANGNDASSSSGSSRPNSPPRDYDEFTEQDIHKSRLSRREQHELQKKRPIPIGVMQPMVYPYSPYIYPNYYIPQPIQMRPRSLPPPMVNRGQSKVSQKKEKKSKKKKSKNKMSDDSDFIGYTSEVPVGPEHYRFSTMDRGRPFQNEKAFAHSIAVENKHKSFVRPSSAYQQFPDDAILY